MKNIKSDWLKKIHTDTDKPIKIQQEHVRCENGQGLTIQYLAIAASTWVLNITFHRENSDIYDEYDDDWLHATFTTVDTYHK